MTKTIVVAIAFVLVTASGRAAPKTPRAWSRSSRATCRQARSWARCWWRVTARSCSTRPTAWPTSSWRCRIRRPPSSGSVPSPSNSPPPSILLLEERGKLKVEDQVKTYLPDAPMAWDRITIFNLLTHTAGIPNFTSLADYGTIKLSARHGRRRRSPPSATRRSTSGPARK